MNPGRIGLGRDENLVCPGPVDDELLQGEYGRVWRHTAASVIEDVRGIRREDHGARTSDLQGHYSYGLQWPAIDGSVVQVGRTGRPRASRYTHPAGGFSKTVEGAKRSNMTELLYEDLPCWSPRIMGIVTDIVGPRKIARVLRSSQPFLCQDLNWLVDCGVQPHGCHPLAVAVSKQLPNAFRNIRLFHATSVEDARTFMKEGIVPLEIERFESAAHDIFVTRGGARIADYLQALREMRRRYDHRDERVFLSLDRGHLIANCGHLLVHGSEYLFIFACELNRMETATKNDFRLLLRGRGVPTVYGCTVPMRDIAPAAIVELASILVGETFRAARSRSGTPRGRRFGVPLAGRLPAENIQSVEHPKKPSVMEGADELHYPAGSTNGEESHAAKRTE